MSWGALIALLIEYKCRHTNNIKHVYEWAILTMQDMKSRELRDRRSNSNTRICFEVRAIALRLRLHTEGFQLSTIGLPHRDLHWEITTYNFRVHNSNSHTSTQEGAQSKERNTT